jgi:hypothetical protein
MDQVSGGRNGPFCPFSKDVAFNRLVQLEKKGRVVVLSSLNNLDLFTIGHRQ